LIDFVESEIVQIDMLFKTYQILWYKLLLTN
jgi:hypothetical protein